MSESTDFWRELDIHVEDKVASILARPTGITPDVYNGITVDRYGRALLGRKKGVVAWAQNSTTTTTTTSPNTINYDTVLYDPSTMITTGASWRALLPNMGWYRVTAQTVIDKNSQAIASNQYWQLVLRKGSNGSLNIPSPGTSTVLDTIPFPLAVTAGAANSIQYTLQGATLIQVVTAPADFYLSFDDNLAGNARTFGAGYVIIEAV